MAMNYSELKKDLSLKKLSLEEKCPKCSQPLDRHPEEYQQYTIKKIPVCEDCYFDALGDLVEKSPWSKRMVILPSYKSRLMGF